MSKKKIIKHKTIIILYNNKYFLNFSCKYDDRRFKFIRY